MPSTAVIEINRDIVLSKSAPLPILREEELDNGYDGKVMLWELVEGG
jgi:hypothetical protein